MTATAKEAEDADGAERRVIAIIRRIPDAVVGRGADTERIQAAEETLGLAFAPDYRAYLREFGALMAGGREFSGISPARHVDVVALTQAARALAGGLPQGFYVVEDLGVDGVLVCQDASGTVFQVQWGRARRLADSFAGYLAALFDE